MLNVGDILEALPSHQFCYNKGRYWEFLGEDGIDELGMLCHKLKNLQDGSVESGFYMKETLMNPLFFRIIPASLENK